MNSFKTVMALSALRCILSFKAWIREGGDYVMLINDKLCRNGDQTVVAYLKKPSRLSLKAT